MAPQLVSLVRFTVPYPLPPATRVVTKWVDALKNQAPRIYEKILLRIPDQQKFMDRLANVSGKAYEPVINPNFVSRAGTAKDKIAANQVSNLKRSYDKYVKKLARVFETVDGVEAKRFKELVDLMKDDFATGVALRTLPFTGTKIEGRSAATIATLWLVNDPRAPGLLRNADELLFGGPFEVPTAEGKPGFKAGLQGRLTQAGANIMKGNFVPSTLAQENNRTNELVNGFRDPLKNIVEFTTGGDSHVDYVMSNTEQLLLEVKVSVTP